MSALNADPAGPSPLPAQQGRGRGDRRGVGPAWTIFRPSVIFGREDCVPQPVRAAARALLPVIALGGAERALPAGLRRRRRALLRAARSTTTSTIGAALRPVRPEGLHAARARRATSASSTGAVRPIVPLGPALSKLQARVLELLPGKLMSRDNLASMQQGQRLRLPVSGGVRHRAGGARGGRADVPRARRAAQPVTTRYRAQRPVADAVARARRRSDAMARALPQPVRIYRVGGSVRDELLGRPGRRPRLRRRRRDAGDDARVGLPAGRPRLSGVPASRDAARNTRSRAPSASTAAAIAASSSSRRPT